MRYTTRTLSALLWCAWSSATLADEQLDRASLAALTARPSLLEVPGGPKEALRADGVTADIAVTQIYQGLVSGDGGKRWEYGGKGDAMITLDGAKLGLWNGCSINVHQEGVWGRSANELGEGMILPVNAALAFPKLGGYDTDTSILLTQNFGEGASVTVGKFNMMDVVAKTPLIGGGGLNTFQHIAFAMPVSGVTPPYLVGVNHCED
jgi:porin